MATEDHFAGLEPFAEVKRAIVVCAHADDMETMMGGLAALLSERGVDLFELSLHDRKHGHARPDTHSPGSCRDTPDRSARGGDSAGLPRNGDARI